MNCRQGGVALVQVLLVTAIIMLLVMQLSLTASDHVRRAQALKDRSEAALFLHSRESAMLYTLLTEPLLPGQETSNPYAVRWNFHGEPFVVDELEWSLQDQSGLMPFPVSGVSDFEQLLSVLGQGPTHARAMAGRVADWIGTESPGRGRSDDAMMRGAVGDPIQYFGELRFLAGMDEQLYQQLAELMTLYPTPGFNPMTAPAPLLRLHVSEAEIGALLQARARGQLDPGRLWQIAQLGMDETTVSYVGPGISVRIAGARNGIALRREFVVGVRPHHTEPLAPWSRERFSTGIPR